MHADVLHAVSHCMFPRSSSSHPAEHAAAAFVAVFVASSASYSYTASL